MKAAWMRLPTDDRNAVIELTPDEVLYLKLLRDNLNRRLEEARRGTIVVAAGGGTPHKMGSDEIRDLERWVGLIHGILRKVVAK